MDIQYLAEISHEFVVLYDKFRSTKSRVFYKSTPYVLPPMPWVYWSKDYGQLILDGDGFFNSENPEGILMARFTHEESAGRPAPLYAGDWCILNGAEEDASNRKDYQAHIKELNAVTKFEAHLISSPSYDRILRLLGKHPVRTVEGISFTLEMAREGGDKDQSGEAREFELAVLRIIAGALAVYCDPIRFYVDGLAAGATTTLKPNRKTQKTAQALLESLDSQGLELRGEFSACLRILARGDNPNRSDPQLESNPDMKRKALVREVVLLAKSLLEIKTGKGDRFPANAIIEILGFVGGDDVHPKTITTYQAVHDNSKDKPLTHSDFYASESFFGRSKPPF